MIAGMMHMMQLLQNVRLQRCIICHYSYARNKRFFYVSIIGLASTVNILDMKICEAFLIVVVIVFILILKADYNKKIMKIIKYYCVILLLLLYHIYSQIYLHVK
ncbi:hypothetical protein ACJX0J_037192, partial [Zea mays]